jgi:2-polyprenyl-3-methyl-5-hydroxy-6-metoxy-1,4-benzoquinol methylase
MSTSWENVAPWYQDLVSKQGQTYHTEIILPKVVSLIGKKQNLKLLDLGCGNGVLERHLPQGIEYTGIDLSTTLIQYAKKNKKHKESQFFVKNAAQFKTNKTFDLITCILAFQNFDTPQQVIDNCFASLKPNGRLILVINHPCFRIPRQTHWQIDLDKKIQYRRIDRYLLPFTIPIKTNPSQKHSKITLSFHHSLSELCSFFKGKFLIETLEEWTSHKKSSGKNKKMEDRARNEFPLFLALVLTV